MNGCSIFARWSNGDTFAAGNLNKRLIDLNFYPVPDTYNNGGWADGTGGDIIIGNALQIVTST
eukprot:13849766-Ditylum_brightwellii.AAC.1